MTIDLLSPEFTQNPYPTYQMLQMDFPVYYLASRNTYFVSRYHDIKHLLQAKEGFSAARLGAYTQHRNQQDQATLTPLIEHLSKWVIFLDPPQHTQVRRHINQAFTHQFVAGLQGKIEATVEDLLTSAGEQDIDVMQNLGCLLPVRVIADLLGVEPDIYQQLKVCSDRLAHFLSSVTDMASDLETQQSVQDLEVYFTQLLARYRRKPANNLMTHLLKLQETDPSFTDQHLIANAIALMFAGHETTNNQIANSVYTLLQHPEARARLRQQPELMDQTIEECLRYESPLQRIARLTTQDRVLYDTTIPKGSRLIFMLGAGNRDPEVFDKPNVFDIERDTRAHKHLSFGHGMHLCSGIHLSRLETQCLLKALLRFDHWQLRQDEPVQWLPHLSLRSMKALPMRFSHS